MKNDRVFKLTFSSAPHGINRNVVHVAADRAEAAIKAGRKFVKNLGTPCLLSIEQIVVMDTVAK